MNKQIFCSRKGGRTTSAFLSEQIARVTAKIKPRRIRAMRKMLAQHARLAKLANALS